MNWNLSTESERHFLGALLHLGLEDISEVLKLVQSDDLFSIQNQSIFNTICDLVKQQTKPDPLVIVQYVHRSHGGEMQAKLYTDLLDLHSAPVWPPNVWAYLESLLESKLRKTYQDFGALFAEKANEFSIETLDIRFQVFTDKCQKLSDRISEIQKMKTGSCTVPDPDRTTVLT